MISLLFLCDNPLTGSCFDWRGEIESLFIGGWLLLSKQWACSVGGRGVEGDGWVQNALRWKLSARDDLGDYKAIGGFSGGMGFCGIEEFGSRFMGKFYRRSLAS